MRRFLGKRASDPKATRSWPVIALVTHTGLLALAPSYAALANPFMLRAIEWFIGFRIVVLALQ